MIGSHGDGVPLALSSCRSATAVHEYLVIAGVVVVQHIVDLGNIEAASCEIGDDEDARFSLPEVVQRIGTLLHVHFSINSEARVQLADEGEQIIDVEPG